MIRMHNTDISSKYTDIAVRNTEHNFTRLAALLLEAQWRKYDSVQHSANGGTTWPFSTPEATWEVQVHVQCLPLSKPFDLTFSFLFHSCELRNRCNSFSVIVMQCCTRAVRYNANMGSVA